MQLLLHCGRRGNFRKAPPPPPPPQGSASGGGSTATKKRRRRRSIATAATAATTAATRRARRETRAICMAGADSRAVLRFVTSRHYDFECFLRHLVFSYFLLLNFRSSWGATFREVKSSTPRKSEKLAFSPEGLERVSKRSPRRLGGRGPCREGAAAAAVVVVATAAAAVVVVVVVVAAAAAVIVVVVAAAANLVG